MRGVGNETTSPTGHGGVTELRVMLGGVAAGLVALMIWARPPDPYIATQLAYTYELGFIPRARWGTLADAAQLMPASPSLTALVGYLLVVVLVAWALGRTLVDRESWSLSRATVAAAAVLSPAGLPFLAANLGRLDTPLLLLGGTGLIAVSSRRRAASIAVVTMLAAAPLVHEAAILAIAPSVVTWTWYQRGRMTALIAAGAAVISTVIVGLVPMPVPIAEFAEWLADRTPRPDPFAILLPYQGLDDALARGTGHLGRVGLAGATRHALLPVLSIIVLCVLALRQAGPRWKDLDHAQRATLLACGAPLLLGLVGTDLGRWWAIATLQLSVVTLHLVPPHARPSPAVVSVAVVAVASTVFLGPVTI